MAKKLQEAYKTIIGDNFPPTIEMKFGNTVLVYEKVGWEIDGENKGLRYGENPGQQAAMYKLINGNLVLGEVTTIQPGRWLVSDMELLQSGKHPGKTNITDSDNALNILRYFSGEPVVAILKHNNPCGVAIGENLEDAYLRADIADRVAAFGGTIALNQPVDKATAEAIASRYSEVIVAPDYEEGAMGILQKKKNLRVMKIGAMDHLKDWVGTTMLDFKSLMDGGFIVQTSYVPQVKTLDDVKALPLGYHKTKTKGDFTIDRAPTEQEFKDMWFGWLVESGITSNSVIYVKDGATVGIGTGEQDRVGVAMIARDKAMTKLQDALTFQRLGMSYEEFKAKGRAEQLTENEIDVMNEIDDENIGTKGGLEGAVAVSDAFFPFRDGVDVCLDAGVKAIIQPGGSERDFESIEACNEAGATMIYTGQRSFKH